MFARELTAPLLFVCSFEREGDIFVNRVTEARFDLSDRSLDPMEVCSQLVQVGGAAGVWGVRAIGYGPKRVGPTFWVDSVRVRMLTAPTRQ